MQVIHVAFAVMVFTTFLSMHFAFDAMRKYTLTLNQLRDLYAALKLAREWNDLDDPEFRKYVARLEAKRC